MATATQDDIRAYPASPILAVSAAVFQGERVLIARRDQPPLAGKWSLPGGGVELGETLAEAAAREVIEETGIEIDVVAPADVVEVIQRGEENGVARHYVIICFAALWRAGDAHPGDGTGAVRWVRPEELGEFDLTEGAADVIAKAAELVRRAGRALP